MYHPPSRSKADIYLADGGPHTDNQFMNSTCSTCSTDSPKEKEKEKQEEEEEGASTASQEIDQMDDVFMAAFTLLKRHDRSFMVACRTIVDEWGMEQYEHFKGSVYLVLKKAVRDKDHTAVKSTLKHYLGVNL